MSERLSLNSLIYKLLIEKDLNRFSITEIRSELLEISNDFTDKNKAHRFIYRQLTKLVDKQLLVKKTNNTRQVIYTKTDLFSCTHFASKRRKISRVETNSNSVVKTNFIELLSKEKESNEADLAVILCEAEEYQELIGRFPDKVEYLESLYSDAKKRSVQLLGKINAIGQVLKTL